jgi:hypothetical protein
MTGKVLKPNENQLVLKIFYVLSAPQHNYISSLFKKISIFHWGFLFFRI